MKKQTKEEKREERKRVLSIIMHASHRIAKTITKEKGAEYTATFKLVLKKVHAIAKLKNMIYFISNMPLGRMNGIAKVMSWLPVEKKEVKKVEVKEIKEQLPKGLIRAKYDGFDIDGNEIRVGDLIQRYMGGWVLAHNL